MKHLLSALVAAAALTGCATVRLPTDRMEKSNATIRAAEELGAEQIPDAKLHLKFAKEEIDEARRMANEGKERAHLLLARSQSDADLALALAHEARYRRDAMRAVEDLKNVEESGVTP